MPLYVSTVNGQPGWNADSSVKALSSGSWAWQEWKGLGWELCKRLGGGGDQDTSFLSQSKKGLLTKWWWLDKQMLGDKRQVGKVYFGCSFKGVSLKLSRAFWPSQSPVQGSTHTLDLYHILLGEHARASTVALDRDATRNFSPGQPTFLPCTLRSLRYVVSTSSGPRSPEPRFKRPLVSFWLLSPLGTWLCFWDGVSFLSTCPNTCFRHRRLISPITSA